MSKMPITPLHGWINHRIGYGKKDFCQETLKSYQLAKLNETINYAADRSLFYRDALKGLDYRLQSLQEISKLPFTTSDQLRNDPGRFLCVSQGDVARIITLPTSGTSGPSKRVYFSSEDQELTIDFFQYGMSSLARRGDRVLILLPGPKPGSVGHLLSIALERLGCSSIVYGLLDDEKNVIHTINQEGVNVIVGIPVQLLQLARFDQSEGKTGTGKIKTVLTSTDYLPQVIRGELISIWGCEVYDHYGMTETGLGGGVECSSHSGFHMREADLFYEIVDPVNGNPRPDGVAGEIVFSTLTRKAMPLIRYRTGDMGKIDPGACSCGSFIRRISGIKSRIGKAAVLPKGYLLQSELDEALFHVNGLMDFSATLEENGDTSSLVIDVWIQCGWNTNLARHLKEQLVLIPVLHSSSQDQHFQLVFREMVKPDRKREGYMTKRTIKMVSSGYPS